MMPIFSKTQRKITQYSVLTIIFLTLGLGWKFPIIGFSVPIVMLTGTIVGIFKGRFICGNLCPRGSFFDRIVSLWNQKRTIPGWMRDMRFRWSLFIVLMSLMAFRLSQQPFSIDHWGHAFWQLCVITTVIGLVLGSIYHPRTWCAFCPMGMLQNVLGGAKHALHIDAASCKSCRLCEKKCPMALSIVVHKEAGKVNHRDCLKCAECIHACPTKALSLKKNPPALEAA